MTTDNVSDSGKPWYKEFWAWFVFAPLILTICVSVFTVSMAFKYKQDVVDSDYHKVGRLIDNSFAQAEAAAQLGVVADIRFSVEAEYVDITIEPGDWALDDSILLLFSHPVDKKLDRYLTLTRVGENKYSAVADIPEGRWYILLSAINDAGQELWRLSGEIDFSQAEALRLPE